MHLEHDERRCGAELEFQLSFDPEAVSLQETPFGVVVDLPGGRPDGTPGGPALPIVSFEVALPPGTGVREVTFETWEPVALGDQGTMVAPLQRAAPGPSRCSQYDRVLDDGLVKAIEPPPFTVADPKRYAEAVKLAEYPVRLAGVDATAVQPIATIVVHPIALTERGTLQMHTELRVVVALADAPSDAPEPVRFSSHAQAERWVELTRSRVVNPKTVIDVSATIHRLLGPAEYLIITDNDRWDADAVQPTGPAGGDLVAEFERLAAWKRLKGLSARVVTIKDIVGGRYGTFNGQCRRDLQEVIREFVKWAHAEWGTAWLLLGGDTRIVPVRTVVGFAGGFNPAAADPPDPGGSHWTGTFLKMRVSVASDTPLLRASDGHRIPYDSSGSSSTSVAGWYFTDSSYSMRSATPTGYVRVNGPAAQVNTELFWLTWENTLPTDLYYADVAGYPERSANGSLVAVQDHDGLPTSIYRWCGGHDWDQVGNRLYGQYSRDADLDGVHYSPAVSVGRAPVDGADEAKTFVDKVLAYERQSGFLLSTAWLRKLLMVSANWGGRTAFYRASTPGDGAYVKHATDDHATIQLATAPSSLAFRVLSDVTDGDEHQLPFSLHPSASVRGWCFARSATDPTPSVVDIPFFGGSFQLPLPTRWIAVYGTAGEMAPAYFVLDESAADGSMLDQELLRTQLSAAVPGWSEVKRLYEDEADLTTGGGVALEHLSAARLEAQLDAGPHIVSLSGHGWWGGCCGLDPSMRTSLTNGHRTFIAYADSCLTNEFDHEDAISESLVQNERGGAVAYVGSTRYSWIGVGDDFQRNFFRGLPATRAIGLLHDRRTMMLAAGTGYWPIYTRWSIFSLNLIGDPEMRIWTTRPQRLCLHLPDRVRVDQRLVLRVVRGDSPVSGAVVTVEQPGFRRQARTDHSGAVTFETAGASLGELKITAYHPEATPATDTIQVRGSLWHELEVTSVRVLADFATVEFRGNGNGDGNSTATVPGGSDDMLALLAQAASSGGRVRVLLDDRDVVEAVELGARAETNGHASVAEPELLAD